MGGEAAAAASRFVRLRLELIEEHKVEELGVERDGAHIKEEEEGEEEESRRGSSPNRTAVETGLTEK